MQLRAFHGNTKAAHQVESEITDEAGKIEEFGEHQSNQDGEADAYLFVRQWCMLDLVRWDGSKLIGINCDRFGLVEMMVLYPHSDPGQQDYGEQGQHGKPGNARLAIAQNIPGQERPERSACIATQLKERLCFAVLPARC